MSRLTSPFLKLVAFVAALAVLGGGTAVAASVITGKQIKNGTITGKDVKKKSLSANHLTAKARTALKGAAGAQGAAGPTGAAGPQGERGPSTAFAVHVTNDAPIPASTKLASVVVPNGNYIVQGKTVLNNMNLASTTPDCQIGVNRGDIGLEEADQVSGLPLGATGSTTEARAYALLGVFKVTDGEDEIELRCAKGSDNQVNFRDTSLVITQVGELK